MSPYSTLNTNTNSDSGTGSAVSADDEPPAGIPGHREPAGSVELVQLGSAPTPTIEVNLA